MLALFGLIPAKDWIYTGIIVALLAGFGWYTHHERAEGADKVRATVAAAVAADNVKVAADDAAAQSTETESAIIYKQAVSIPAIDDIGVVCQRAARPVPLPTSGTVAATATGNESAVRGVGPTYDPSGSILERAHEADAEISYLQRRVAELEKQMNDAP